MTRQICALLALASLVVACGAPPVNSPVETTRVMATTDMLAQIRASGSIGNELDVQPLRDSQVEDLRTQATQAEQRGDYPSAERAVTLALRMQPGDPDLLQWQAELALVQRRWTEAEALATRSFNTGPKLGGLCRRNWMTLQFARQARGDGAGSAQAQQRIAACTVAPPVRM
jgi:hypothetical protein